VVLFELKDSINLHKPVNNIVRGCYKMARDVLCEVNNCKYWDAGNKCSADSIYIVSHKGEQASDNKETDCKTFESGM
jgi:hypothetical protein